MKKFFCFIFCFFLTIGVFAQEALKSIEEEYFDLLSLQGLIDRPTLGYRTLSDSVWNINEDVQHIWKNNNLGKSHILFESENQGKNWFSKGFFHGLKLKLFGPEWFNSYNTTAPYGQNDGALWQGRGYNTSFTTGVRLEGYGFEVTFKPQLSFSQNLDFEIMPSNYDSEFGYFWGYGKNIGIDVPQRFGTSPFFTFDWGDSEIRYSWKTLTIGFGTQSIWLGPAQINPILHSNNAPTYPKIDVGLRKTEINIPWWDNSIIQLGKIEFRLWTGYLTESKYFDNNEKNNHNMFHGLQFAYEPSFLQGFTFFINRTCLVKWDIKNLKYIFPQNKNTYVGEENKGEDQKTSFGFSWFLFNSMFNFYFEIGLDDYVLNGFPKGYIRYPLHTLIYTTGFRKAFHIKNNLQLICNLEINYSEMSQDFQFQWPYNFGFHHQISQGYTNKGQFLGTGYGYGGNMQYLDFTLLYPKGKTCLFISRNNPDNNYLYSKAINKNAIDDELEKKYFKNWKANFNIGFMSSNYFSPNFMIKLGFVYNFIINEKYDNIDKNNFIINIGIKYTL